MIDSILLGTQAAKNRLAHTEPAAGAVGLAAAAARLGRADISARFLHLRALNPYVASIAEGFSRQRGWVARRQPGALPGSPDLRCGPFSPHASATCCHVRQYDSHLLSNHAHFASARTLWFLSLCHHQAHRWLCSYTAERAAFV